MKIQLGPFGNVTPGVAPAPDLTGVGRGLAAVGEGIANIGLALRARHERERQEAHSLARVKALNGVLDYDLEAGKRLATVGDRLERGELEDADARQEFLDALSEIEQPRLDGLDELAVETVNHGIRTQRERAVQQFDELLVSRRVVAGDREHAGMMDRFAVMASLPNADPADILRRGEGAAVLARGLGVPTERVEARRDTLRTRVAEAMATRDPAAALEKLATTESGDPVFDGLSFEGRQDVQQHAQAELVTQSTQAILGTFETLGPDEGSRALLAASEKLPDDLADDVRAAVQRDVAQLRAQRREERAPVISQLESRIAIGTATQAEHAVVEALWDKGALSTSELAGYHAQIDRVIVERAKDEGGVAALEEALAQGIPLDPLNTDHKKALDAAFAFETLAAQPTQPAAQATSANQFVQRALAVRPGSQQWQAIAMAYAGRTRMLPTQALSWTRSALRSPQPELAAAAAQFVGSIDVIAPEAIGQFDQDARSFAATVNAMIESGTQPAQAVETARAIVYDADDAMLKRRQQAWSGAGGGSLSRGNGAALVDYIDDEFDVSMFSKAPGADDPRAARYFDAVLLQPAFDAQAEKYFLKTGDAELARDEAWKDVRRVFGPSKVNGVSMMMAFPPERFGVTPDEVRHEIEAIVAEYPPADGTTAADVVLVPDRLTLSDVSDALSGAAVRPSWLLVGASGDALLTADGVRIRYTVPSGEETARRIRAAQAEAAGDAQRQVDAARTERERRIEQRRQFAIYPGSH